MDNRLRKPFSEANDCRRCDLVDCLQRLCHLGCLIVDPGNGQQIFHHIQKPVGIVFDRFYQFPLFGFRQLVSHLQIETAAADDAGQRCSEVMGNGSQKVHTHFFLLRLHQRLFLLSQLALLLLHVGAHDQT